METAPMLTAVWNDLSDDVLALILEHPELWFRLLAAGKQQFHAYAIWLALAERGSDEQAVAYHIYEHHPRVLLTEVFPESDHRLWRVLQKLPEHALRGNDYQRIARLASGPAVTAMLAAKTVLPTHLQFYETLETLDPLVAEAHQALGLKVDAANRLHSGLTLLREFGLLERDEQAAKILRATTQKKQLRQFLVRRLGKLQLAVPDVPTDSKLKPMTDLNMVMRQAHQVFRNCLRFNSIYWSGLLTGKTIYFTWSGQFPAILAVEVLTPGIIAIEEIEGPDNENVPDATKAEIVAEFSRIGMRVLSSGYSDILSGYSWEIEVPELEEENELILAA